MDDMHMHTLQLIKLLHPHSSARVDACVSIYIESQS